MKQNQGSIPSGWVFTTVGSISDSIQYGYTASTTTQKLGPKILRITDIQENKVDWNLVPHCKINVTEVEKYRLAKGDIVFARTGATVGKSYLISKDLKDVIFASYLIRIRLKKDLIPGYLAYFFKSRAYWEQISKNQVGIGQPNFNGTKLAKINITLPSVAEQKRIVSKIEELFSDLDAGEAALKKMQVLLKQYRQSVLKAAVTGELTNEWRAKNKGRLESGEDLLKRILKGRKEAWSGKGKYKEPQVTNTLNLPNGSSGNNMLIHVICGLMV